MSSTANTLPVSSRTRSSTHQLRTTFRASLLADIESRGEPSEANIEEADRAREVAQADYERHMAELEAAVGTPALFPKAKKATEAALQRLLRAADGQAQAIKEHIVALKVAEEKLGIWQEGVGSARLGQLMKEAGCNI